MQVHEDRQMAQLNETAPMSGPVPMLVEHEFAAVQDDAIVPMDAEGRKHFQGAQCRW